MTECNNLMHSRTTCCTISTVIRTAEQYYSREEYCRWEKGDVRRQLVESDDSYMAEKGGKFGKEADV